MPDRLKFRVWDHMVGKFMHFDLREVSGHVPVDIPDRQIQQSVGVTDAEGRLVYEGDIVYFDNSEWSDQGVCGVGEVAFSCDLLERGAPGYGICFKERFLRGMNGRFEVIGNCFENPELLDNGAGMGAKTIG